MTGRRPRPGIENSSRPAAPRDHPLFRESASSTASEIALTCKQVCPLLCVLRRCLALSDSPYSLALRNRLDVQTDLSSLAEFVLPTLPPWGSAPLPPVPLTLPGPLKTPHRRLSRPAPRTAVAFSRGRSGCAAAPRRSPPHAPQPFSPRGAPAGPLHPGPALTRAPRRFLPPGP